MRLIDADKLKEFYFELVNDEEVNKIRKLECLEAMRQIDEQPTAVGQCRVCKRADWCFSDELIYCLEHSSVMRDDGFCNCFQEAEDD